MKRKRKIGLKKKKRSFLFFDEILIFKREIDFKQGTIQLIFRVLTYWLNNYKIISNAKAKTQTKTNKAKQSNIIVAIITGKYIYPEIFYVHVTVHRDKFLYNKTN